MYTIKKKGSENIPTITLTDYINPDGYCPKVVFNVTYSDKGFHVHFDAYEKKPKRVMTQHFQPVHLDSCLEWFINFDPEHTDKYINFEVNANGAMQASLRKDRYDYQHLTIPEIESLGITPKIEEEFWSVKYTVSTELIKKYYPKFDINTCKYVTGNMQKCGDKQKAIHYMSLFVIGCEKPDFHRPEYFGKIELI